MTYQNPKKFDQDRFIINVASKEAYEMAMILCRGEPHLVGRWHDALTPMFVDVVMERLEKAELERREK